MARDEKVDLLASVSTLGGCSPSQLRAIARHGELLDEDPGRVLIFEGGESHEVFLVLRGEAEVSRSSQPVAVLREGAFFGEVGVLASHCRDAQVRATTRMLVLVLGRREFIGLLAAIPPLNRSLLGGMASRLHESDLARGAR